MFQYRLFETSSKTGDNVDEMFLEIARDYLKDPKTKAMLRASADGGGGSSWGVGGSGVLRSTVSLTRSKNKHVANKKSSDGRCCSTS